MIVQATRFLRKLPGGSQGHLLEADDGNAYVVKFKDNPQQTRTLVNEWIAAKLLDHLAISHPRAVFVRVDADFLRKHPNVGISNSHARIPVAPGLHFGSQHPGHREGVAVYDFLPDQILLQVANLDCFMGVLAVDLWTGHADQRQCIFVRDYLRKCGGVQSHPLRKGYIALMIDNGAFFGGSHWLIRDYHRPSCYARSAVYAAKTQDSSRWIRNIEHFSWDALRDAQSSVPAEWVRGEDRELSQLVLTLYRRRAQIGERLEAALRLFQSTGWERQAANHIAKN